MPPPGINNYWEPWPPVLAATLFLKRLNQLLDRAKIDDELAVLAAAFSLLPEKTRRRCKHQPGGNSLTDTFVFVEANDGSQSLEGVVVDGQRDEDGDFDLENYFWVFTTIDKADGELIRCNGANCHVEILSIPSSIRFTIHSPTLTPGRILNGPPTTLPNRTSHSRSMPRISRKPRPKRPHIKALSSSSPAPEPARRHASRRRSFIASPSTRFPPSASSPSPSPTRRPRK